MFYPGDKVFDIRRKKSAKIVNLRDNSRENKTHHITIII